MGWEFDFLHALQNLHTPILDNIMIFTSTLGDAGAVWVALTIILLCIKKYRKCGLHMFIAMLIGVIVGNLILKNAFQRIRPYDIDLITQPLGKVPTDFSFPSGHSMNSVAAAFTIFFYDKRIAIPSMILAIAICFSRMYNFVHYPTDVFGGVILGVICSLLAKLMVDYFYKRKEQER